TDAWPPGFKQSYTCQVDAIRCSIIWRYLDINALGVIERDSDEQANRVRTALGNDQPDVQDIDTPPPYRRHFSLFRYMSRRSWPADFIIGSGEGGGIEECGGLFEFYYYMPPLTLDVALIENPSGDQVTIDDLLGRKQDDSGLRPLSSTPAGSGQSLLDGT